ncbi:MAG: HEPN domain-containing protein [Actinobacteria bacterium]|nr:HEPN domain-containing protein [Actinomycetota bacterium]
MQHSIKDLILYRLEKSKQDFESAKILIKKGKYAQSLNRSYYAIFHSTRALLAMDKFDSRKHSGVISFFVKNYIATGIFKKEYSKIILRAEKFRNRSDYMDFYIVTKKDTERQLKDAKIFIGMLEKYILKKLNKKNV